MSTVLATAARRNSVLYEWLSFTLQFLIAVSVELSDDLARGLISQHGTIEGVANAQHVVAFEAAHGFWVEPAWQIFFEQTHTILAFTVTWPDTVRVMNGIYVLGHIGVTLGVALWVYFYHRRYFGMLRNAVILTNLFALLIYERFPVAPPRLTPNLIFNHHSFTFQDTLYGVFNATGRMVGTSGAYNEFSAMPSIHVAWALIVGAAVIWLARPLAVKALGLVYPFIMLVAVVVTGNHYLLDAAGAVVIVVLAALVAGSFERWKGSAFRALPCRRPAGSG